MLLDVERDCTAFVKQCGSEVASTGDVTMTQYLQF